MEYIGTHIVGTVFVPSTFHPPSPQSIMEQIWALVVQHGMTPVGQYPGGYKMFSHDAFTGFIMLCESHVSLHTWYELGFVHLDVFTCNVSKDNTEAARHLFEDIAKIFHPTAIHQQEVKR